MKIGLKLWSTNAEYVPVAKALYERKLFQYIELFVVPYSAQEFLPLWQQLAIPYILHAPHSYAGINFSIKELAEENEKVLDDVNQYACALKPAFIIFHPGIEGSVQETVNQICKVKQIFPDIFAKAIIENKPAVGLKNERCIGASFEEISLILNNISLGFCLDFGHAFAAAEYFQIDHYEYAEQLFTLNPSVFHVSDGHIKSLQDEHLNLGNGNYDFVKICRILKKTKNIPHVTLETKKASKMNLDDFEHDVYLLRKTYEQSN
jgi:deoxyribonuclease-4